VGADCEGESSNRLRPDRDSSVSSTNGKFELTASKVRIVTDAPRGAYIPVSHSLIVCWRMPISLESAVCDRPR
jgi:hypothetical protein